VEGPHGGCLGALEKGVIRECDRAGQAHFRHLLQGLLQGQNRKQRPKGVAPLHRSTASECWMSRRLCWPYAPATHGQQGRAALCDGGQHAVAAHGVERVLPVDLRVM
jgi:hypothetical protein